MHFCRVVNDEICFHSKEAYNLYEMFHTRYSLHKQVRYDNASKRKEKERGKEKRKRNKGREEKGGKEGTAREEMKGRKGKEIELEQC